MTQLRLTLILVGGGLLLITPLLSRLLHGADNSIFSVMSTLTEVRENLEDKKVKLQALVKQAGTGRDPVEVARRAREHHRAAREIHDLTQNFLKVALQKFPRYESLLSNVKERVTETHAEIDKLMKIATGKAPLPKPAADIATGPLPDIVAPPERERTGGELGALVAGEAAKHAGAKAGLEIAETPEALRKAAVPEGPAPAGAILPDPSAALVNVPVEAPRASVAPAPAPVASAAARAPEPLRERYKAAYSLFVKGSPDALSEAKARFQELLKVEPNYYLARYWLVKTHVMLGETEAAQRQAKTLLASQPHLQAARQLAAQLKLPLPASGVMPGGVPADLASSTSTATSLPGEPKQETAELVGGLSLEHAVAVLVEWKQGAGMPSGLSRAALIHELPDAADDSRLVAIFKALGDKPPRVGPLAHPDAGMLSLARTYGAVAAVHAGLAPQRPPPPGLQLIDHRKAPGAFVKDELKPAPYNNFVHLLSAAVEAAAPADGVPAAALAGFPRSENVVVYQTSGATLSIPRGGFQVRFRYDGDTGQYHRIAPDGKDAIDAGDGQSLIAANIIVQQGAPRPDGTRVRVYRGGNVYEGRLTRDPDAPLVNARARPILLNPGAIWVIGDRGTPPQKTIAKAAADADVVAGEASAKSAAKPATDAKPAAAVVARADARPAAGPAAKAESKADAADPKAADPKATAAKPAGAALADAKAAPKSGLAAAKAAVVARAAAAKAPAAAKPAAKRPAKPADEDEEDDDEEDAGPPPELQAFAAARAKEYAARAELEKQRRAAALRRGGLEAIPRVAIRGTSVVRVADELRPIAARPPIRPAGEVAARTARAASRLAPPSIPEFDETDAAPARPTAAGDARLAALRSAATRAADPRATDPRAAADRAARTADPARSNLLRQRDAAFSKALARAQANAEARERTATAKPRATVAGKTTLLQERAAAIRAAREGAAPRQAPREAGGLPPEFRDDPAPTGTSRRPSAREWDDEEATTTRTSGRATAPSPRRIAALPDDEE